MSIPDLRRAPRLTDRRQHLHLPLSGAPERHFYAFTLFDLFEHRLPEGGGPSQFGWEARGWIGGDFNKFWWKHEGEAVFDGDNHAESETDLLYSRLITPFWNVQAGVQYANK